MQDIAADIRPMTHAVSYAARIGFNNRQAVLSK